MINGDLGDTEIPVVTYPCSLSLVCGNLSAAQYDLVCGGWNIVSHFHFLFLCGKTVCAQPMHIILHIILALMGASAADSTSTLQGMCVTGHFCPVCFDVSPSSYLTMVVL